MLKSVILNWKQTKNYMLFLNSEIGTDFEVDEVDNNKYTITIFGLEEGKEYDRIKNYEKNELNKEYVKYNGAFKLYGEDTKYIIENDDRFSNAEDELSHYMGMLIKITGKKAVQYNWIASNIASDKDTYYKNSVTVKIDEAETVVKNYLGRIKQAIKNEISSDDNFYEYDTLYPLEKTIAKYKSIQTKEALFELVNSYANNHLLLKGCDTTISQLLEINEVSVEKAKEILINSTLNDKKIKPNKESLEEVLLSSTLEGYKYITDTQLNQMVTTIVANLSLEQSAAEHKASCGLTQEEIQATIYTPKDPSVGLEKSL